MADLKPLRWIAKSREDLCRFPDEARRNIGFALQFAQAGTRHPSAKALRGFGGAGVLEVVEDFDGQAFRTIYTVNFGRVVYVLHAFQKKSKSGIKTPKHEIDLVHTRLRLAEEDYREWSKRQREFSHEK